MLFSMNVVYFILATWPTLTLCHSTCCAPSYDERYYNKTYTPTIITCPSFGKRILSPDSPYVAAVGRNQLYFIDTKFDVDTARDMKENLENLHSYEPDTYLFIDEIAATAERRRSGTRETVFVFNPVYARVFFAEGMNRRNPSLQLPVHEEPGDWVVTYDLDEVVQDNELGFQPSRPDKVVVVLEVAAPFDSSVLIESACTVDSPIAFPSPSHISVHAFIET